MNASAPLAAHTAGTRDEQPHAALTRSRVQRVASAALSALAMLALAWALLPIGLPRKHASGALGLGAALLGLLALATAGRDAPIARFARAVLDRASHRTGALRISGLAAVALAAVAVLRHLAFGTAAFDLGLFDQAVRSAARGGMLESSLRGGSLLGDHWEPSLALLAPLAWISNDGRALLVVQALALALGAVPIASIARRHLGHTRLAALFPLLYVAYAPLRGIALADFHPEALSVPLFLFAIDAAERGRLGTALAFVLVPLGFKETTTLAVAGFGAALLVGAAPAAGRRGRIASAVLVVAALALFVVALEVVVPRFNPGGFRYTGRYSHLGDGLGGILTTLVTRPWVALEAAFTPAHEKWGYLAMLLGPLAFLSLAAPRWLLGAAPAIAMNLLAAYPAQRAVDTQYAADIVPFVFAASIAGTARALAWLGPQRRAHVGAVLAAASLVMLGRSELALPFEAPPTSEHRAWKIARARIPEGASVSAESHVAAHLSRFERLRLFPDVGDAEWVAVDTRYSSPPWLCNEATYLRTIDDLASSGRWARAAAAGHLTIWQRLTD